ncbi:MAG: aspartate kinase [Phascolarctobacterium sp.]|nr:aspartate kinase [Phascolarctobacterium sp.]
MMKIIVQKFGGTSVSTLENRKAVLHKVQQAIQNGYSPVVVVSAMGRKGDAYATDTLIDTLKAENPSVSNREMDMLMCCGELISSCIMTAHLQQNGIKAMALTGGQAGIITDSEYGAARIKNIKTSNLFRLLEDGFVPVVCGFQGVTENNGNFTTLGRGGSDTTAAALGAALHAECVEIYTDVNGIMTADPRIVKNASTLENVSYQDVQQMAINGAKVIHPRAVEIAMSSNIPLIVKSTFTDEAGTVISNDRSNGNIGSDVEMSNKIASGIANMGNLVQFRVTLNAKDGAAGQKVFQDIANAGISVSFLNLSEKEAMFATFNDDADKTCKVLDTSGFEYVCNRNCGKVTVILAARRGMYGLMASFVTALSSEGIAILQTVDSDNTISAIIKEDNIEKAVRALHKEFKL